MKLKAKYIVTLACLTLSITTFSFLIDKFPVSASEIEVESNFPVTRRVGWIEFEDVKWKVKTLTANFKEKDFNLFNDQSYIKIYAQIQVFPKDGKTFKPKKLFINQRYIAESGKKIALIEITPIFELNKNNTNEESNSFDLQIAEPVENRNWGKNYFRVMVGKKFVDLTALQAK